MERTQHELEAALPSAADVNRLRLAAGAATEAMEPFVDGAGGLALVAWLRDGVPYVLTNDRAAFAVVIGTWLATPAPPTPRTALPVLRLPTGFDATNVEDIGPGKRPGEVTWGKWPDYTRVFTRAEALNAVAYLAHTAQLSEGEIAMAMHVIAMEGT